MTIPPTFGAPEVLERFLCALAMWRESRGEPVEAQLGVLWVILNRANAPGWWGHDIPSIITCHNAEGVYQFTSFDPRDPNASQWPTNDDAGFLEMLVTTGTHGPDPTGGATNYYSPPANPEWAPKMTFTVQIGKIRFYK